MNLRKPVIFFAIALLASKVVFSQETNKAVLIDEFGKLCSEDFMARADQFYIHLQNDPNAIGYIVFTGDRKFEGRNVYWVNAMTVWYPRIMKRDLSRIVLVRGENQDDMKVQFWLVPAGATPPKPDKEFKPSVITETILFDRGWADLHLDESKHLEIYSNGFFDNGCEFPPNVGALARTLLENPDLTGYLITYTKFGRGARRGIQVGRFAVNNLGKEHKIPRKRLKMIYGGSRKQAEVELWLVPKGQKPPIPTPGKKAD
jgi:hypothetical protein